MGDLKHFHCLIFYQLLFQFEFWRITLTFVKIKSNGLHCVFSCSFRRKFSQKLHRICAWTQTPIQTLKGVRVAQWMAPRGPIASFRPQIVPHHSAHSLRRRWCTQCEDLVSVSSFGVVYLSNHPSFGSFKVHRKVTNALIYYTLFAISTHEQSNNFSCYKFFCYIIEKQNDKTFSLKKKETKNWKCQKILYIVLFFAVCAIFIFCRKLCQ